MKFYLFCFFVALTLSQTLAPTLIYSQGNFVLGNENGFLTQGICSLPPFTNQPRTQAKIALRVKANSKFVCA